MRCNPQKKKSIFAKFDCIGKFPSSLGSSIVPKIESLGENHIITPLAADINDPETVR